MVFKTPQTETEKQSAENEEPPSNSCYCIDVSALCNHPGMHSQVHRSVHTPCRIGVDMIGVDKGDVVDLDLELQSVGEGIYVTGTVSADVKGQCARCLKPIDDLVNTFIEELFVFSGSKTDETTGDEYPRVVDNIVDLEQTIIDSIAGELPLSPVCEDVSSQSCKESDKPFGQLSNYYQQEDYDPRLAALKKFRS